MGKAARIGHAEMEGDMKRIRQFRDHLEQVLCREPQVFVNGSIPDRLATVTNLSFGYTEGPVLLAAVTKQTSGFNRFCLFLRLTGAFTCTYRHGAW